MNLKVPVQYLSEESGRHWIYGSENQDSDQKSRHKFKSYHYLLISQYVIGEDPEREDSQGTGTIQNLRVQ